MDKQIWFMVYGFVCLQPPNMVKYDKQVHAPRNAKSSTTMSTQKMSTPHLTRAGTDPLQ